MNERHPIIYLPIEFKSREFESKILIAATLAERGYSVVIGQQWMLYSNIPALPPGTMLFKNFSKVHHPAMIQARRAGHRVLILEEELLGHITEKDVLSFCTDGLFQIPDAKLSNGQFERDVLRKFSSQSGARIEVAGNPRIELLKPKFRSFFQGEIHRLRSLHGDFVLINTNFGILNSIWGLEKYRPMLAQAGYYDPNVPASVAMFEEYIAFERANHDAMHAAIRDLALRRPNQRIVVRPHPAEDLRRWDGVFSKNSNVVVVREGSHVPWTLACRLLLHTSCTTGFEAYVGGTPAFSLVPSPSPITNSMISNRVNRTFQAPGDLIDATERVLDGDAVSDSVSDAADVEKYVWNCKKNDALERVADHLTEGLPKAKLSGFPNLRGVVRDIRLRTKFEASPQEFLDVFAKARRALGLKSETRVHPIGDSLFLVVPT
jgi:surface carbohydrate biosynthesis protein